MQKCKHCGDNYSLPNGSGDADYCGIFCYDIARQKAEEATKKAETIDHSEDITLIRACLTVLGAVDKKNATLVSVAVDALDRIEKGGK